VELRSRGGCGPRTQPDAAREVDTLESRIASVLAAALFCVVAANVPRADELYEAQAIVTGQREPERLHALPDCLEDALIKVSGDPRLIGDPRLVPLKANAADLVAAFRYHDRMSGIPVHDEQGTRDRPYDLTVSFEPAKIDAALRSLGLEPWTGPRPRLALFIGVQNGPTPYVLSSDGDRGLEQKLSLQAAAYKRGISIVLPAASMLAAADVRFDRLSKIDLERWQALGKDAGGDTALIGTLFWIEQEFGWRADWRLVSHGDHRWQIRGVNFDAAFRNAMEGSAQILSGHGEPK
jgi:uncharacterized protein